MSHPTPTGQGVAYDPIPNLQDTSDIHETPYDPPSSERALPALPDPTASDLNIDEPSVTLVRPRFLGNLDGEGEGIRGSVASYDSRAQSEGISSLYALNPESLSAQRSESPGLGGEYFPTRYLDDPNSLPLDEHFDGHSVPLSTLQSQPRFLAEKQSAYASYSSKSRRNTIILSALGALVLLLIAVILPVYFLVIKHNSNAAAAQHSQTSAASSPSATSTGTPSKSALFTGGDGSTVTMEDGTTFTYSNPFGGSWYYNPNDPFNNAAQAQSWSPPLNQTFNYGSDRIRGYVTWFLYLLCCYERKTLGVLVVSTSVDG
jgi:glucan 1,3-beta-glucosidase